MSTPTVLQTAQYHCPICWEPNGTFTLEPCHHQFHQSCITTWATHQLHDRNQLVSCPCCRSPCTNLPTCNVQDANVTCEFLDICLMTLAILSVIGIIIATYHSFSPEFNELLTKQKDYSSQLRQLEREDRVLEHTFPHSLAEIYHNMGDTKDVEKVLFQARQRQLEIVQEYHFLRLQRQDIRQQLLPFCSQLPVLWYEYLVMVVLCCVLMISAFRQVSLDFYVLCMAICLVISVWRRICF